MTTPRPSIPASAALCAACLAVVLGAALGPFAPALAQGLTAQRQSLRAVERAIRTQIDQAIRPRLEIANGYDTPPGAVAVAPTSSHAVAVDGGGNLRVFDLRSGIQTASLDGAGRGVVALGVGAGAAPIVALSREGRVSAAPGAAGPLAPLDLGGRASALALTDEALWVGFSDGRAALLDGAALSAGETRTLLDYRAPAAPTAFAARADGTGMLAGLSDGSVVLLGWDGTARPLARGLDARVTGLSRIDAGRLAAGTAAGSLYVLDAATGAVLARASAHSGGVSGVAVIGARTGTRILTTGMRGGVVLWRPDGRRAAEVLPARAGGVAGLAIAGPGVTPRALVSGPDRALHVVAAEEDAALMALHLTRSGWGAVDDLGRFDGDPTAFENLAWTADALRLPVENLAAAYFEPGLLGKHLNDQSLFLTEPRGRVTDGILPPPAVSLSLDDPPARAGERVRVRVALSGVLPDGPVEIRLYHNGRRVADAAEVSRERDDDRVEAVYEIVALEGANDFHATAIGWNGIESVPARGGFSLGEDPEGALRVTAIGINDYAGPEMRLNYAVADARGIASLLTERARGLFRDIDADLLLDARAERDAVLDELDALAEARPEDAVVLFLSGHARTVGEEWYFLPRELADLEDEDEVLEIGISGERLTEALVAVPANRVLVIVDSCQSGAVVGPLDAFRQRRALQGLKSRAGVAVIAATRADQLALEYSVLGHGVMTYTLLAGMQEGAGGRLAADMAPADGRLTAGELKTWVETEAPRVTASLDARFARVLGARGAFSESVGVTPVGLVIGGDFELVR